MSETLGWQRCCPWSCASVLSEVLNLRTCDFTSLLRMLVTVYKIPVKCITWLLHATMYEGILFSSSSSIICRFSPRINSSKWPRGNKEIFLCPLKFLVSVSVYGAVPWVLFHPTRPPVGGSWMSVEAALSLWDCHSYPDPDMADNHLLLGCLY